MGEILKGIIGVVLGLSIAANAALLYNAYNQGDSFLNNLFPANTQEETLQADAETESTEVSQQTVSAQPAVQDGLAMYTSARMPVELGDTLYQSVHSMVYDNEAVFYIAYSNEVAANEAGYSKNRADYDKMLNNLWAQNLNRFLAKNKEYSDSLKRYDSDAYATFFIVDDDDHEKILAVMSDGVLYYNIATQPDLDPFSMYNTRWNKYIRRDLAELLDDPSKSSLPSTSVSNNVQQTKTENNKTTPLNIGETWTVDGQWKLTINSVTETNERNEYSEKNPGAVYIVDYSYTNIGYEDDFMDGLYFSLTDIIVDSAGVVGYSYPGNIVNYPKQTPVGATCNAQACIGVDNAGNFSITIVKYDGNDVKQNRTFQLKVD